MTATDPAHLLDRLLREVPFFRSIDRVDGAKLIGALEEVHVPAGGVIVAEGAPFDGLYLFDEGSVQVSVASDSGERTVAELAGPGYFGEYALILGYRTATARAMTDLRAWKLPRERFEHFVRERPALAFDIACCAVEQLERSRREAFGAPAVARERSSFVWAPPRVHRPQSRIVGLLLAIGIPLALWPLTPPGGLGVEGWHVVLILLGATVAWWLEPAPDFVVALAMAAAWTLTGLVPISTAFSGFASSAWVVSIGAFALAVSLARSGLFYRTALLLLTAFPATHLGQVTALLLSGVLVTPVVPLPVARVAAVTPLIRELADGLGYAPRTRATAAIAFAGLVGYGLFAAVFMTGLVSNFFLVDLLPPAERARFDWVTWLVAAAPVGGVIFVGGLVAVGVLFRPESRPRATAEGIRRQARALGPLSRAERTACAALLVLVAGVFVQRVTRLDTAVIGIAMLVVLVIGGSLDRERFRSAIDWGFLIFFGVLLSTGAVLRAVGIDRWLGDRLMRLADLVGSPAALLPVLAVFVIVARLLLPSIPGRFLLMLALVPAAAHMKLSPWLVGFVILTMALTWLHPNLSDYCRLIRDATGDDLFDERQAVRMGVAMTLVTLLAIVVSIPYWRALGLVGN